MKLVRCLNAMRTAALTGAFSALAAVALLPATEPLAWAQPAPSSADSVTTVARQRYNEGVAAYDAGRFEDARSAFLQAYALKHHPAVLLNLGQAEVRSGHYDDAGNHLQQFVREWTSASPDQRAAAEKGIADAKKHTGLVEITVDSPGADVSIDGTTIGKTPLPDRVFVTPGKHTIFAGLSGKTGATSVEVKAGATVVAAITLGASAAPPAPPPTPPVPVPTPPAPEPTPPPVAPPPAPVPPPAFPPPGVTPVTPPSEPPPSTGPARETFGQWYRHKPVAWVGTGLVGLGLIGGIAFGAQALSASNAANSDVTQIQQHNMQNPAANPNHVSDICKDTTTLKTYAQACSVLQGNINNYHTDVALAGVSWALFGVGAVGTAVYAMVDWYPHRASSSTGRTDGAPPVAVAPMVGPGVRGVAVGGSF